MMPVSNNSSLIRRVLPTLVAVFTQESRYLPNIVWEKKCFIHNCFRLYELIFWRRAGVRPEMSAIRNNSGKVFYAFHTLESALVHFEGLVRKFFKEFKIIPFKVYIPQIATPQGIMFPSPYLFAIALGTTANNYAASGTQNRISFTATGSDRISVATVFAGGGDLVTSYQVNAVSGTQVTKENGIGGNNWGYMYYFIAPSASAVNHDINSSASNDTDFNIISYSGAKQTGQMDSFAIGTATGNLTLSTTVVASNCWLISWGRNTAAGLPAAGTGTTLRVSGTYHRTGDSNGTVGTGAQTMQWTNATGTTVGIIASIAPVPFLPGIIMS